MQALPHADDTNLTRAKNACARPRTLDENYAALSRLPELHRKQDTSCSTFEFGSSPRFLDEGSPLTGRERDHCNGLDSSRRHRLKRHYLLNLRKTVRALHVPLIQSGVHLIVLVTNAKAHRKCTEMAPNSNEWLEVRSDGHMSGKADFLKDCTGFQGVAG